MVFLYNFFLRSSPSKNEYNSVASTSFVLFAKIIEMSIHLSALKKISGNVATWNGKRQKCSFNRCSQNDFDFRYWHWHWRSTFPKKIRWYMEMGHFLSPSIKKKYVLIKFLHTYTKQVVFFLFRCNFEYRMTILFTIHYSIDASKKHEFRYA